MESSGRKQESVYFYTFVLLNTNHSFSVENTDKMCKGKFPATNKRLRKGANSKDVNFQCQRAQKK